MPIRVTLLAVLGAISYWVWRAKYAVQTVKELDRDTKGSSVTRNAGLTIFGNRLERVRDPRLAATILMLQISTASNGA